MSLPGPDLVQIDDGAGLNALDEALEHSDYLESLRAAGLRLRSLSDVLCELLQLVYDRVQGLDVQLGLFLLPDLLGI